MRPLGNSDPELFVLVYLSEDGRRIRKYFGLTNAAKQSVFLQVPCRTLGSYQMIHAVSGHAALPEVR